MVKNKKNSLINILDINLINIVQEYNRLYIIIKIIYIYIYGVKIY